MSDATWEERDRAWEEEARANGRRRYAEISRRYPMMARWSVHTYPRDENGRKAIDLANRWSGNCDCDCDETHTQNLYLHGGVGTGKSGLAWSLAREMIERGWDEADFLNVPLFLAAIRRSYSHDTGGPDLDELADVWLLVLDDLGAERTTDWSVEQLGLLVERRYQLEHPTIVTSNYRPSELVARLGKWDPIIGQRIISRLVEDCTVYELDGPDRRLRNAA